MTSTTEKFSDEMIATLNQHYEKCIDNLKSDISNRDKYFITMLSLVALIVIKFSDNNVFEIIIIKILDVKNSDISSNNIVNLFLWIVGYFTFIRYSQFHSNIEISYKYINKLETKMNNIYGGELFTKESSFYAINKKNVNEFNKIILKVFFPLVISISIITSLVLIFSNGLTVLSILEVIVCSLFLTHLIIFAKDS